MRKSKRQVEDISIQAEEHLERHFIRRLHRLVDVRRFVIGWVGLLVLSTGISVAQLRALSPHYQELAPVPGGTYTEGVVGSFTNANPLFATGAVDNSVASLVFSSLFKYDRNGKLVGDLAKSWSVDETERVYTVALRDDVRWHDGEAFNSEDVVFTYRTIQNPDTQSALFTSWRDVTVKAVDDHTVTFTLPNTLASFPYSLTNGIVPAHKLESIAADQLRSNLVFNTVEPIGTGPFTWDAVEVKGLTPEERQEHIALNRNESYFLGAPKLQRFTIKTFRSEEAMIESFERTELNAMSGLASLPDVLHENAAVKEYNIPINGSVMVFFKTSDGVLSDKAVRQALIQAVNTKEIVNGLPYPAIITDSPLLRDQLGYSPEHTQLPYSTNEARKKLDEAGWKVNQATGKREKEGKVLSFSLDAPNSSDFTYITQKLREAWSEIGVDVNIDQPEENEFQSNIALHQYDALLYGISIGQDPDVFAFWHSSQADVRSNNRLNLSEYNSDAADKALESGRTRTDPELRAVKYEPFLKAWRDDAPALALHQPRFLYAVRGKLYGFDARQVNSASDRYANVHMWMIRSEKQYIRNNTN